MLYEERLVSASNRSCPSSDPRRELLRPKGCREQCDRQRDHTTADGKNAARKSH